MSLLQFAPLSFLSFSFSSILMCLSLNRSQSWLVIHQEYLRCSKCLRMLEMVIIKEIQCPNQNPQRLLMTELMVHLLNGVSTLHLRSSERLILVH